jgi:hypothetical protein
MIKTSLLVNFMNVLDKPKTLGELKTVQLDSVKTTVHVHIQKKNVQVLGIVTMLLPSPKKLSGIMTPMPT